MRAKRVLAKRRGDITQGVVLRTIEPDGRQRQLTLRVDSEQASSIEVRAKDIICLLVTEAPFPLNYCVLINCTTMRTFRFEGDQFVGQVEILDELRR